MVVYRKKLKQVGILALIISIFCCSIFVPAYAIDDDEFEDIIQNEIDKSKAIKELNSEIEGKALEVSNLAEKLHVYEENIEEKQQEQLTLESQLSVLDEKIAGTETDIEKSKIEIEVLQLEIEALQEQIRLAKDDIGKNKERLTELLDDVYLKEQKTFLEIIFTNETFSEFFSELEYINRVRSSVHDTLSRVQRIKMQLETRRTEVKEKKAEEFDQKQKLELTQSQLEGEEVYKEQLLVETELSEEKFQALLENARQEQALIESSIASLEEQAQEKIFNIRSEVEKRLADDDEENDAITEEEQEFLDGTVRFNWPSSSRTVTCGFHCKGYPFERWFKHSGADLSMPFGSEVQAAASGYVTIVRFDGTSSYAYIMIVHGNGLASVYGHLSAVNVDVDQYVRRGQVIGSSGGIPGTPGAGSYSTGAHLHFEIRVDGIATDPIPYLP